MNFFSKIKFLHKNYGLGYWVFLVLFTAIFILWSRERINNNTNDIYSNMKLTVGQTIGIFHANYSCYKEYVYKANDGNYYKGSTDCFGDKKICDKYLIAYSTITPEKSVLFYNIPLNRSFSLGTEIENKNEFKINKKLLMKWDAKGRTHLNSLYDKLDYLKDKKCD